MVPRRLLAEPPPGWLVKKNPTLFAPDGRATVITSRDPSGPSPTTTQYADLQGELLVREFSGFRHRSYDLTVVFGEFPGYVREFSRTPPGGVELTLIQCSCVVGGRGYPVTTPPSTWSLGHPGELRHALTSASVHG